MTNSAVLEKKTTRLTAYNRDVQRFIMRNEKCTTQKKTDALKHVEEAVVKTKRSFEKMFPAKSKRYSVMDEVLFLLSGPGICKVESKTLANRADVSIRTVFDAVRNLKDTGEVIVAGLADGKNKYIFVLKSHPNFKNIMKEVFFLDIADHNAEDNAVHIAEQKNLESLEAVSSNAEIDETNITNSFNSFNSKQERDSIQRLIEAEASQSPNMDAAKYISTYYVNEHQRIVYDYIKSKDNDIHKSIQNEALVIGLRVGSNIDKNAVGRAIKTIIKIDIFIKRGGVVREGIPAIFSSVYQHGLEMSEYQRQYDLKNPLKTTAEREIKPVPFYNWLEERD